MDKQKVYLSWQWVNDRLEVIGELLEKIGGTEAITRVAGIPRGGLIPAVMFSHTLGIPYISYSSAKALPKEERKKVLVIDDICDTCLTLKEATSYDFRTAALSTRYGSEITPTLTGETVNHDRWLVFPWEDFNAKTVQDYLVNQK